MEALKQELKGKIIEVLNLEDISVADINDNDALFGDGLGLDSIDALELIVLLDKDYGIKLVDPKEGKTIFQSPFFLTGSPERTVACRELSVLISQFTLSFITKHAHTPKKKQMLA